MVEEGQPDSRGFLVGAVIGGILCGLGLWRRGGGTSSMRMVLAQSDCKWTVYPLCGIMFFEIAALKM